jgi:hypothetical protein
VIPFEREPHRHRERDPRSRSARGGADDALLEELERKRAAAGTSAFDSLAGWLVAPLLLASVAAGLLLVTRGADRLFAWAFGCVLALGLAWIVVSALFPGRAERECPNCGRKALVRLDPKSTRGLRCSACSWRDADTSSFLLAEDDGAPLEDIAMRERRRRW